MVKEPLRLFLLAHPKSMGCQALAVALMRRFVDPPATAGLRIPTRFTPDRGDDLPPVWDGIDGINLDFADHTLVVLLSDSRMVRTVSGGTGDSWKQFFQEGVERTQSNPNAHYVFGIAADSSGFGIADDLHMIRLSQPCPLPNGNKEQDDIQISEWLRTVVDDAALQITVRCIQKLEPSVQPTPNRAPLHLFLSHAKADLSPNSTDPVRYVENDVKELPIDYWFDAAEIPPSADFKDELAQGIRDCSIVVSFLTDHYSSRNWCQREVMDAKRFGVPVLVVDALDEGEPRHFPYIGNVPVVHWKTDNPKLEARRVVSHAARETLRYMHNRAKLSQFADATGATVLATAPEALTLVHCCHGSTDRSFVYPDPPLAEQELGILRALVPDAKFTTPLTELARNCRSDEQIISVSISDSGDLRRFGLCGYHEQTLADEICLYLLLTGCRIAYGGALSPQIQTSSNFTLRLFEIVRGYSLLAQAVGGSVLHPIMNYAPWPLRLAYNDQILSLFGNVATLTEGQRPTEIAQPDTELFSVDQDGKWDLKFDTPQRRFAWARGLTAMRIQMTQETTARIVIGGKGEGFTGIYPGVFEEAWLALVAGKPLFLCGAFGGASRALVDAIVSERREAMLCYMDSEEIRQSLTLGDSYGLRTIDTGDTLVGLPDSQSLVLGSRIAEDFARIKKHGVAVSLRNGLSDEENHELFYESEPAAIADLVLRGLSRKQVA